MKDNLAVTLESIEAQDYADIEVVIVNGQSTDGTLDVIRELVRRHTDEERTGTSDCMML